MVQRNTFSWDFSCSSIPQLLLISSKRVTFFSIIQKNFPSEFYFFQFFKNMSDISNVIQVGPIILLVFVAIFLISLVGDMVQDESFNLKNYWYYVSNQLL